MALCTNEVTINCWWMHDNNETMVFKSYLPQETVMDILCSHGMIMREIQDSYFGRNSVGKLNVSLQSIKHNNSKRASIRGNYEIGFLIILQSIILLLSLFVMYQKQVLMQWPPRRLRIAWYGEIIRNVNWEKLIGLHGKLCQGKHLPSTKNVQWQ